MDEFNGHINNSNECDVLDRVGFTNSNQFNNNDYFVTDENLLDPINQINECHGSNSFLNPVSEMLNDIEFCCDQSLRQEGQIVNHDHLNNWIRQDHAVAFTSPSIKYLDGQKGDNDNKNTDSELLNISSIANSVLLPECTTFPENESLSSVNQWFSNLNQVSLIASRSQLYRDNAYLNTMEVLPTKTNNPILMAGPNRMQHSLQDTLFIETSITSAKPFDYATPPMQADNSNSSLLPLISSIQESCSQKDNYINHKELFTDLSYEGMENMIKPSLVKPNSFNTFYGMQPIVTTNSFQSNAPATTMPKRELANRDYNKNILDWANLMPHKQLKKAPEMIIMHPLRTRKISTQRRPIAKSCENINNSTSINLSEYFDTSCIDIPIIRERKRSEVGRRNRRKQKLNVIPGSDHLIFDLPKNNESLDIPINPEHMKNEVDPYPETELPELDEIFKRKKKCYSVHASNIKHPNSVSQSPGSAVPQKKQILNTSTQPKAVQETSISFEQKVYVPKTIQKRHSNVNIERSHSLFSSETDSEESDNDNDKQQIERTLKCQKCRKLFKTTRSLSIHMKRCADETLMNSHIFNEDCQQNFDTKTTENDYNADQNIRDLRKLNATDEDSTIYSNLSGFKDFKYEMNYTTKQLKENVTRPITRSQTRQSTGRPLRKASVTKYFK